MLYAAAWRRRWISAADDVTPWLKRPGARAAFFAAGLFVSLLALQSPIDTGGDEYLFALHMLQHLLLMMVAPPLLILGVAGMRVPSRDRYKRVRRAWWVLTRPWVAITVFNAVMLVWHIPALYDTTLTTTPVHILEHLSFIAAGLIAWWPIVDPIRGTTTKLVSPLEKIAVLVVSGIPPTVLGLIFALAPSAFYDFYVHAPRLWGISPVSDQQYGGVLMLGLGNIIYFVAITVVFVRLLGDSARDEEQAAARLATGRSATADGRERASRTMSTALPTSVTAAPAEPVGAALEGGFR